VYYTEVQTLFSHDLLFRNPGGLRKLMAGFYRASRLVPGRYAGLAAAAREPKTQFERENYQFAMHFAYVDAQLD
jgi:hypothetical protein